jgi:hypothetical protein
MGRNDEYSRDAHEYELAYDSDESDEFDNELDPEDWQDMYSEELLDAWMNVRGILDENYIQYKAGYPDFVELVLHPTKWYSVQQPSLLQRTMWLAIKDAPIVGERLQAENFYAWSENFIDYF